VSDALHPGSGGVPCVKLKQTAAVTSVYEKGGFWHNRSFPFQISKNLKKISYEPHRCRRNFSQPQTSKNLLRKWSRFCKNIL
jgi:hypothetical protein